jgi:hypothetical protein
MRSSGTLCLGLPSIGTSSDRLKSIGNVVAGSVVSGEDKCPLMVKKRVDLNFYLRKKVNKALEKAGGL